MKLYIPVGIPGSGKTTWLRNKGVQTVSPDAWRVHVYGGYPTELFKDKEAQVWELAYQQLAVALEGKQEIGFDACNITAARRQDVLRYILPGWKSIAVVFNTPQSLCISRQIGRRNPISEDIIVDMAKRLEEVTEEEGFDLKLDINE